MDRWGLTRAIIQLLKYNGDSHMVLIESSEILDTLKLLHSFAATFSLQETSKAYHNVICLIQLMEKESTDKYEHLHQDAFADKFT